VKRSGKGGFLVPTFTSTEAAREIMARRTAEFNTRAGLDSATATKGQELKFTVPGEFLEILRNYMATITPAHTLMAGLQGPVAFPAQTGAGTATWVGENPGVDVADSNLTARRRSRSTPKSIQSSTSYSRQLLAQSVIDVDALVKTDLARIIALASTSPASPAPARRISRPAFCRPLVSDPSHSARTARPRRTTTWSTSRRRSRPRTPTSGRSRT
jgi:hypothetical protein